MYQAFLHGLGQLLAFFYDLIPNYGVSIILLTIVIRAALVPLSIKQAKVAVGMREQQQKMAKIQPELKRLQAKYRDDRQQLYVEQSKLLKENDINPAGCLRTAPLLLIQMPIMFGIFMVLRGCKKFFSTARSNCVSGLYLPAGSALQQVVASSGGVFLSMRLGLSPRQAYIQGGLVDALPYYVAILVMAVVTWLQQKILMKDTAPPPGAENDPAYAQMQSMNRIMKFLPFMIVISSFSFPVGLTVYWIVSSAWTIVEKSILNRRYGAEAVAARAAAAGEVPTPKAVVAEVEANGPAPKQLGRKKAPSVEEPVEPTAEAGTNGPKPGKPKGTGARRGKKKKKKGKRR